MPKYYRFRAHSPTLKSKSCDDRESDKKKEKETLKSGRSREAAFELTPAQLWYLRRTSWREPGAPETPAQRRQADRWIEAMARCYRLSHL